MRRMAWVSLFCLVGLVILVSLKFLAPAAKTASAKIPDSHEIGDELPLAFKTDKLPEIGSEPYTEKSTIQTVKIQPSPSEEFSKVVAAKRVRPVYARMRHTRHAGPYRTKRMSKR